MNKKPYVYVVREGDYLHVGTTQDVYSLMEGMRKASGGVVELAMKYHTSNVVSRLWKFKRMMGKYGYFGGCSGDRYKISDNEFAWVLESERKLEEKKKAEREARPVETHDAAWFKAQAWYGRR